MGGRIRTFTLTVTTVGGDGAATGTAVTTESVEGYLLDIYVNYHASAPAGTTDIVIKQTDRTENLYAKTNSATDALVAPRLSLCTTGAAAITDGNDRIPINGTITATVSESNALTACAVVTVRVHTL